MAETILSTPQTTSHLAPVVIHVDQIDQPRQFGQSPTNHPSEDLRWLNVLAKGLGHRPFLLKATQGDMTVGQLPLALVKGPIFGRFLVGLPFVNSGGVVSEDSDAAEALISKAVELTETLDCRYLELRHEEPIPSQKFNAELTSKVHMRLELPEDVPALRASFKASVRNQVKKGEKQNFTVRWGQHELVNDFYKVFSRRMRDLGTPVFGKRLFQTILSEFRDLAEICCVHDGDKTVAAGLLLHGSEVTEVPSASSLPEYNKANANMFLYWNLLSRAVERGQKAFDFGRSTKDSGTYRFKKQWGAKPVSATWQYYLRSGSVDDMRPDSGKKKLLIQAWQRLPVWLTQIIGPTIVRGIP